MRSIVHHATDSPGLTGATVVDDAAVAWLGAALHQLDDLARLEQDWDSYDALPPTPMARSAAGRFLEHVAGRFGTALAASHPTSISPLPTGGIELEWRRAEALIAIDVDPGGSLGYLLKTGVGGDAAYREETQVADEDLLVLIADVLAADS